MTTCRASADAVEQIAAGSSWTQAETADAAGATCGTAATYQRFTDSGIVRARSIEHRDSHRPENLRRAQTPSSQLTQETPSGAGPQPKQVTVGKGASAPLRLQGVPQKACTQNENPSGRGPGPAA
jgi:hypothetical protein